MKTTLSLLLSFVVVTAVSYAQTASADEAAVKKLIVDESGAFFAKNREQWANSWVHEPYVSWSAQGGADHVLIQSGWEAYSGMFDDYFNSPATGPAPTVQRDNIQVNVLGDVATVSFLQTRPRADGSPLKSREVRVLEKHGNDWKLAYVHSRNIQ